MAHTIYLPLGITPLFTESKNVAGEARLPAKGLQCTCAYQGWNMRLQSKGREFPPTASNSRRNIRYAMYPT